MSMHRAWLAVGLVVILAAIGFAVDTMVGSTDKVGMDAPAHEIRSAQAQIEVAGDIDLAEFDWEALWLEATEAVGLRPSDAELASITFEQDPQGRLERWAVSGERPDGWRLSLGGQWLGLPRDEAHYLHVQAVEAVNEATLYYSPRPSVVQALAALQDLDWSATLPLQSSGPAQGKDIVRWECMPGMAPLEVTLATRRAFVWQDSVFRQLRPTGGEADSEGPTDPVASLAPEHLLVLSASITHRGHPVPASGGSSGNRITPFLVPLAQ